VSQTPPDESPPPRPDPSSSAYPGPRPPGEHDRGARERPRPAGAPGWPPDRVGDTTGWPTDDPDEDAGPPTAESPLARPGPEDGPAGWLVEDRADLPPARPGPDPGDHTDPPTAADARPDDDHTDPPPADSVAHPEPNPDRTDPTTDDRPTGRPRPGESDDRAGRAAGDPPQGGARAGGPDRPSGQRTGPTSAESLAARPELVRRKIPVAVLVAVLVGLALGMAAFAALPGDDGEPGDPATVVRDYLDAATTRDCERLMSLLASTAWEDAGMTRAQTLDDCRRGLGQQGSRPATGAQSVGVELVSVEVVSQDESSATVQARLRSGGSTRPARVEVVKEDGEWRIDQRSIGRPLTPLAPLE
jgi:hypothetical protein